MRSHGSSALPQVQRYRQRLDIEIVPPHAFITDFMQFAMVDPADRYGKLVAHFHAQRTWLSKTQVMGVGWAAATNDAGLR